MVDVKTAISGGKTAFELAKSLMNGLAKGQIQAEEVPSRLMELQQHILNMQSVVHDLAEENRVLKGKLDDQQRHLDLTADMDFVIDGGFYIRKSEADKGLIAYCPVCWQKDSKTVPMQTSGTPGWFWCSVHRVAYRTEHCREVEKQQAQAIDKLPRPASWMDR